VPDKHRSFKKEVPDRKDEAATAHAEAKPRSSVPGSTIPDPILKKVTHRQERDQAECEDL
jgi:hypothetical protein